MIGTYRKDDNEQKVDVGDIVELEIQVLGHEANWRVLGCAHFISHKLLSWMSLLIPSVFR